MDSENRKVVLFKSDCQPEAQDKRTHALKKFDDEQQVVFGEVYAPNIPDSQGDFMTALTIREMAYDFMKRGNVNKIDVQHSQIESGSYVVESFIAREDDPIFIPGSWVLGVKVTDPKVWEAIKSGELNGFSLDGTAQRAERTIEMNVPPVLTGETLPAAGHVHKFSVRYAEDGTFLGGETSKAADGHSHLITSGTVTEITSGHQHRFSFIEGVGVVSLED